MFLYLIAFTGIIYFSQLSNVYAESSFQPCAAGDEECMINKVNDLFFNHSNGYPDLNIPALEPLVLPKLTVNGKKDGPVDVELTIDPLKQVGHKNLRAVKISGFGSSPEGHRELFFTWPKTVLSGPYTATGKLFDNPMDGKGEAKITAEDLEITIKFEGKSVEKDGEIYMSVNDLHFDFTLKKVLFEFDNLMKGNKQQSEQLLKLWNSSPMVLGELYASLVIAYNAYYTNIITKVFESYPYNDLVAI